MSRLYSSGFELQSLTDGVEFSDVENGSLGLSYNTSIKRSGACSLKVVSADDDSNYVEQVYNSSNIVTYARFFMYVEAFPSDTSGAICQLLTSGGVVAASIAIRTDGKLELFDGSIVGTSRGVSTNALSLNTWYCIRIKVENGGSPEIEAQYAEDGDTPSTFASGVMTEANNCNSMDLGMPDFVADFIAYFDDWGINDNGGSENGYPHAQGKIVHLKPNAAGDNAADAGLFSAIDEVTPNDVTDFIDLDNNTSIADYNIESPSSAGIGSGDEIRLVEVGVRIREESAAGTGYRLRIKSASGGTTVDNGNVDAGSTAWRTNPNGSNPFRHKLVRYTDPTTGVAWTPIGTNSLENAQIGVASSTNNDIDITTLWLLVEYVASGSSDITINASVLSVTAAVQSPAKTLQKDASLVTATATTPTSVPEVRKLPAVLAINAVIINPSLIIDSNFNAPVLAISANLQTPVHQILMQPSVLATTAALQALQDKVVIKSPGVIAINTTVPTPVPQIIKTLSELSATALVIAPTVNIGTDWSVFAPVITATATVNTPAGEVKKDIAVILATAAVQIPNKLVSKDIATIIANAQVQLPSVFAEKNITINAPTLTAIAIVTPTSIILAGPAIGDIIIYSETMPNTISPQENMASSTVYSEAVPNPSSTPNSISDEVIYDEDTQWGGGNI